MALAAAPLTATAVHEKHQELSEDLDEEILHIRAQIRELTEKKRLLSSALLQSSNLQSHARGHPTNNAEPSGGDSLLTEAQLHAQINVHRLAFGVTAFPFSDPSPETSDKRLLGIRIDVAGRKGKYDKPYYVICKRTRDEGDELQIHRHTIPVFIRLREYEEQFLPPLADEHGPSNSSNSLPGATQDLQSLAQKIRHDLVSWTLRREAIDLLNEQLGLTTPHINSLDVDEGDAHTSKSVDRQGRFGVKSLSLTAVEARFARIEWVDGRIGRVKIADDGIIERAVIWGHDGRSREDEAALLGENVGIEELATRLELLHIRNTEDEEVDVEDDRVSQM